jgi:hypothetical protein
VDLGSSSEHNAKARHPAGDSLHYNLDLAEFLPLPSPDEDAVGRGAGLARDLAADSQGEGDGGDGGGESHSCVRRYVVGRPGEHIY